MKKDIMVIREAMSRIVSMLTRQAIRVTQRGTRAYVKYHPKTGAIIEMNIPYLPDDASEEFIAAVQGFLDHEVGHVLFSDSKVLLDANKLGQRVANLANIVEDVFVERKMTEAFQGSSTHLESVRRFYLEKIARIKIDEAIKRGATEEARGYATVAGFRAWGGQTTAMDFIKEPHIAALLVPVKEKIGDELLDQIAKCESSRDCLNLAAKIKDKLEVPTPPPPPPPPPEMAPEVPDMTKGMDFGEPEPGKGDAEGEEEEDDSDAAGEPSELSKDPAKTEKSSDAKPDGKEDDEDDEEDEDEREKDGVEVEDSGIKGEEKSDKAESKGGDSKGDSDEEGDSDGAGEDEESDAGPGKSGDTEDSGELSEEPSMASMFDEERDFDKDVGERLSKDAGSEIERSSYVIFSKEWDVIAPAVLSSRPASAEKMHAAIADKVGVMQKQLERAIAAKAKKAWSSGKQRGRISPGALFKTSVGDDRVFRQRTHTRAKNTAVSLVIDCSGSMSGSNIELASTSAYALATVLERLKITYEVIGFTTGHSGEMATLMKEDAEAQGKSAISQMGWGRIEPLYMPVFKPFSGRLDTNAVSRIAHLHEHPHWLSQNVDGECIQIAAHRLLQQDAERRIMIVLSDGEPCARQARGLGAHLQKAVAEVTANKVDVIGIGIQTHSVKSYYPKHIVLNDVESLPTQVMAELSKLLLA